MNGSAMDEGDEKKQAYCGTTSVPHQCKMIFEMVLANIKKRNLYSTDAFAHYYQPNGDIVLYFRGKDNY